jgi:hypothetical protein
MVGSQVQYNALPLGSWCPLECKSLHLGFVGRQSIAVSAVRRLISLWVGPGHSRKAVDTISMTLREGGAGAGESYPRG